MTGSNLPRIAVIADAHFHDPGGDCGLPGIGMAPAFRRLAETARSTRLFNESATALRRALDDVAARGIRLVVLLGDYSDDGQIATLAGLARLLDGYRQRHGIAFFAVPGNHDIFGPDGRHRSKRFLAAGGGYGIVTSDPGFRDAEADRVWVSGAMYCQGYPQGLRALPGVGFFRSDDYLHWETPFGTSDAPAARHHAIMAPGGAVHRLMDASYLVEPAEGLWLMMIDANVFVPRGEAAADGYADSTDAGWTAMLRHKRFVLDWMAGVAARARALGKCLLTFSHYPALGPLDGSWAEERATLGASGLSRRIPEASASDAVLATGIGVHFSGHLHINDTSRLRRGGEVLVNVSLPSLVAYPAAYKIVTPGAGGIGVQTVEIGDMALDPAIMARYRAEAAQTGLKAGRLLGAADYGALLWEHAGHLVARRHLRREWPADLAALVTGSSLADLAAMALDGGDPQGRAGAADAAAMPALEFLEDWYRLRMGGELAATAIAPDRLRLYRRIARLVAAAPASRAPAARLAGLFRLFERYLAGLPSRDFTIDRRTGEIARQQG